MSKTAVHVYIKSLSNIYFFSLGCYLCRKENKQIDYFFTFFPPFPFPSFLLSFLSPLCFLFWCFLHFSFPSFFFFFFSFPLSKVLQSNFSNYSSRVRDASSLNLHSAFNSCQGFTCIYQNWNVLLYIMLNQLEVKELNHWIHESKMLCFPIAITLGDSHFQLPKWPSNMILTTL